MSNFTNVANELAKKFISAKDKKYVLNKIIYDINYLVYTDTKEPLSYKSKSAIIKYIFEVVAGRKALILAKGETLTPNFSDVVVFFERRSSILKHLRNGVKSQQKLN
ncbi:hypothetical protein [Segetibacter aerophilus]|uniref:Uncharacterized protein n=1 Tax=Segetibacter aerophilus TaxID=670293 RepID=A0A512BJE2_9BACT|nr:hypothetical protein [Segetibacter aerophilus]GEO12082.1 hypothetical protein SAE01_45780 [Segetibacter aerophilus]